MDSQHNLTFGRYFKKIRTEKGISLETVSAETRIGIANLVLIENEDHERLPATVFVKGFLRAYAKAIGVDGDEAIRLYLSSLRIFEEQSRIEADLVETGSKFWFRLMLSLFAMVCLMFLSVGTVFLLEAPPVRPIEPKPVERTDKQAARVTEKEHRMTASATEPVQQVSEKLLLDVRAVEDTWMKVQVDEQMPKEYSLKPGERLALEAILKIDLLIGNAGGGPAEAE